MEQNVRGFHGLEANHENFPDVISNPILYSVQATLDYETFYHEPAIIMASTNISPNEIHPLYGR